MAPILPEKDEGGMRIGERWGGISAARTVSGSKSVEVVV